MTPISIDSGAKGATRTIVALCRGWVGEDGNRSDRPEVDSANYVHGYIPRGDRTPEAKAARTEALEAAVQRGWLRERGDAAIIVTVAGAEAVGAALYWNHDLGAMTLQ